MLTKYPLQSTASSSMSTPCLLYNDTPCLYSWCTDVPPTHPDRKPSNGREEVAGFLSTNNMSPSVKWDLVNSTEGLLCEGITLVC
ncbi:hypothetical protein FKM82_030952 [Ascaphus truei]